MLECDHRTLICVGCDRVIIHNYHGQALAIACSCGAMAPLLYCCTERPAAVPASLALATGNKPPPHIQYYLGFSAHESALKTQVTQQLRALGSVTFEECTDAKCNASYARDKERRKYWEDQAKMHEGDV